MFKGQGEEIRELLVQHKVLIKDIATHTGCKNPLTITQFLSGRFVSARLEEYFTKELWRELVKEVSDDRQVRPLSKK